MLTAGAAKWTCTAIFCIYSRPMQNRLLTILAWLMMLAIPTQGFAAAIILYCGPNHQGVMMGPEAASTAGRADTFAFQRAVPDAQFADSGDAVNDRASAAAEHEESVSVMDPVSAAVALELSPKTKCSVCALCCSAAAVVSSPLVFPPLNISSAPMLTVPESPVSFLTDGPKRPPRSVLV